MNEMKKMLIMNLVYILLSTLISFGCSGSELVASSRVLLNPFELRELLTPKAQFNESESMSEVLNFIDSHIELIRFAKTKQITVMLGDTDHGEKALLNFFMTDEELLVNEDGSGDFTVIDRFGNIGKYNTSRLTEYVPDKKSALDYYLFPNLNDTFDFKNEILTMHMFQRILRFAETAKFIFTMDYWIVSGGNQPTRAQQLAAIQFVTNATRLLSNLEQFNTSIGIVFINVAHNDDFTHTQKIVNMVNVFRVVQVLYPNTTQEYKFINLILEQNDGTHFDRLSLSQTVNETGFVRNISWMQTERKEISLVVQSNIKFVEINDFDLHYTLSNETIERIPLLIEEVESQLSTGVREIGSEIQRVYELYESQIVHIRELSEKMSFANDRIKEVISDIPLTFGSQLVNAIQSLNMDITIAKLSTVLNHIELHNFLVTSIGAAFRDAFDISEGLSLVSKYLTESTDLYSFLSVLYDRLIEYDVQKNTTKYQTSLAILLNELTIREYEMLTLNETSFKEFVGEVGLEVDPEFENMTLNVYKCKTIRAVLTEALSDVINSTCTSNRLVASGINVKLSDVIKIDCFRSAEFVEIYALNKLFIDADIDKSGQECQMSLFGQTWDVIGKRVFNLDGILGPRHNPETAANGTFGNLNGTAGLPGLPGLSSGRILCVGETFNNESQLEISLRGGKGGRGQNGGKGFDGQQGKDPNTGCSDSDKCKTIWDANGHRPSVRQEVWEYVVYRYIEVRMFVRGLKNGIRGGRGGDGGVGGNGGEPGQAKFIGLKSSPQISTIKEKGERGDDGIGGKGGAPTRHGNGIVAFFVNRIFVFFIPSRGALQVLYVFRYPIPAGDNGVNGNKTVPIKQPKSGALVNPSFAINTYKGLLREHLAQSVKGDDFERVLDTIERNDHIRSQYDTLGLINDLETIENHYLKLRRRINFLPYIESLLNRTQIHASNLTKEDNITASRILYTTIKSKVVHMKTNENRVSVVDLPGYLEMVRDNIMSLKQAERAANIDEYKNQFRQSVDDKITDALQLIKTQIIPEVNGIVREMADLIVLLINEISEIIQADVMEYYDLEDKRRQAQNSLITNLIMGIVGLIGAVLTLVCPVAGAVVSLFAIIIEIGLSFTFSTASLSPPNMLIDIPQNRSRVVENQLYEFMTSLNNSMTGVMNHLSEEHNLFSLQLDDIELELMGENDPQSNAVRNKVVELKKEVRSQINSGSVLDPRQIELFRKELIDVIDNEPPTELAVRANSTRLEKAKQIAEIGKIAIGIYKKIREDNAIIAEIDAAIKEVLKRIKRWQEVQKQIIEVLVPMLIEMQKDVAEIAMSLSNQTGVQLDISKWRMQSSIRDVKTAFKVMSTGTSIQPTLERSFDKLDEAMTTVVNIYDRIDSYKDKAEFAEYLTDVISGERPSIKDPVLNSAVLNLRKLIQSNRVLEQWEIATQAYKQHKFPFAAAQLSAFDLPPSLEFNDTDTLIARSVEQLNFLRNQVILEKTTIGQYDREVYSDIEFFRRTRNKDSTTLPFYVWNYEDISDEITRFFKGEEIILTADIRKGLNFNAVKFNTIEFRAVTSNSRLQYEIDKLLTNTHKILSMSMLGNNYYRCGERIFYVSVDENIVLESSLDKLSANSTIPIQQNDVYRKVANGEYFLSPYTMWKIQMKQETFSYLNSTNTTSMANMAKVATLVQQYGSGLHVELVGRGQYFKNELFAPEICSQPEMNKFYHEDTSTSPGSVLRAVKFRYSLK